VLDLSIRRASAGRRSLDAALRTLYRSTYLEGRGYDRKDVENCLSEAAGADLSGLLAALVDGPLDPDFPALLEDFGLRVVHSERDRPHLGLSFQADKMVVAAVGDDGPALASGIAPLDEILAIDGVRVTTDNLRDVLSSVARIDRPLSVLTASRGLIVERVLTPTAAPVGTVRLELDDSASPERRRLRDDWLCSSVAGGEP
jgi:predicted metalloprotease with PDZ domain